MSNEIGTKKTDNNVALDRPLPDPFPGTERTTDEQGAVLIAADVQTKNKVSNDSKPFQNPYAQEEASPSSAAPANSDEFISAEDESVVALSREINPNTFNAVSVTPSFGYVLGYMGLVQSLSDNDDLDYGFAGSCAGLNVMITPFGFLGLDNTRWGFTMGAMYIPDNDGIRFDPGLALLYGGQDAGLRFSTKITYSHMIARVTDDDGVTHALSMPGFGAQTTIGYMFNPHIGIEAYAGIAVGPDYGLMTPGIQIVGQF